jgi:hypothetical protein
MQVLKHPEQIALKASEILKNCKLTQCRGMLWNGDRTEFCAIGALAETLGFNRINIYRALSTSLFHESYRANRHSVWDGNERPNLDFACKCPECGRRADTYMNMIIHLNDSKHRWTFKQIGEWLEKEGY